MTVQVQSGEQLEQAAEEMEDRAERIANVTYTRADRNRRGRRPRRREHGDASGGGRCRGAAAVRAGRPQRSLPVRQRQEVQAVPRQAHLTANDQDFLMPVNLSAPDPAALHAVPGVRIGVAEAGIRKANRKDLTVVLIDEGASVGGVFTQNRFCAAPVQVCREHLARATRHPRDGRSTPATRTPAPAKTAWRARARPASRWRASWTSRPSRCCRFPPA